MEKKGNVEENCWQVFLQDVILHVTQQIESYARRDHFGQSFHIDDYEIYRFFGSTLFTGFHSPPSENEYWSIQQDLQVPIVHKVLLKSLYQIIKKIF